jgi:hypothetical protein
MSQHNPLLIALACTSPAAHTTDVSSLGLSPAREFQIRNATSRPTRSEASALLARRYTWRGYGPVTLPQDASADRLTLVATIAERTVSTLTVRLDGPVGLAAEALFRREIGALQRAGERLCEFGRLAAEALPRSAEVLAGLFHVGYLFTDRLHHCDSLVMEVNPRHVAFYRRMLGAEVIGSERIHPGIGAPAVLLQLRLSDVRARVEAARNGTATRHAFYSLGLSPEEEMAVLERLLPGLGSAALH